MKEIKFESYNDRLMYLTAERIEWCLEIATCKT